MKKAIFLFLFIAIATQGYAQLENLEIQLFELPDVIFTPIESPDNYQVAYELKIRQPLDHQHPEKGHFYQKVFLSHRGVSQPTVIVTEGYSRSRNRIYELSDLLQANQIQVEHRFFGDSAPDSLDYSYLTLEQVTADLHRIRMLFKNIYQQKWISTGISKGGQTTIFYRYFYPNDVSVSVPYVAPLNLEFEDQRIYNFLDTIGSQECRNKIKSVQVRILQNRRKLMPLLRWYAKGAQLQYDYLSLEEAFEFAVLEYPFSFWQWGHDCSTIPGPDVELEELLEYFLSVSGIDFFSDRDMKFFAPHYYQAANQMGYYGYETEPFSYLLEALPPNANPHAAFTPNKMKVSYDNSLAKKVAVWLKEKGDQFIYINGAIDTWSATAVPKYPERDALWFDLKGKDHRMARIRNMSEAEKKELWAALSRWLNIKLD
ncbi:MAG: S28 family serine protease [Bacteroidota bacterium]